MLCKCCNQELPKIFVEEEKPIIVGKTIKKHGFNGFKTIEIGSNIYSFQGFLYLEQESEKDNSIHKVRYYKEQLNLL